MKTFNRSKEMAAPEWAPSHPSVIAYEFSRADLKRLGQPDNLGAPCRRRLGFKVLFEGAQPETVRMRLVPSRRARTAIARLSEVVDSLPKPVLQGLSNRAGVVGCPMVEGAAGRIGVVADEEQACCTGRHAGPFEWRRDIHAVASILPGNISTLGKRTAFQRQSHVSRSALYDVVFLTHFQELSFDNRQFR